MRWTRKRPSPQPLLFGRPSAEIMQQVQFLTDLEPLIHGPQVFGDTYQNLILSVTRNGRQNLTELLLSFGVTDVDGLLFLLRTVSISSSVEALRWAADDLIGLDHLHGTASISHPLVMAVHHPEVTNDPALYKRHHPELYRT